MLRTLLTVGLSVNVAAAALHAEDAPVFSGPQPGERIVPFKVQGVYGEEKGREFDFVQMAADSPFMLVFIHTPTRPAGDLTRVLLHFADTREYAGLFAALIYLTDDVTEAERKMIQAYGWWNCGPPAGISLDGAEGPGAYGLNRNVTMTVLVGTQGKVTANFALVQPSDTDAARILPAVTELAGGIVPSVAEIEFLSSPSLLPPIVKQWQEGKTPTDRTLRTLFCQLLREGSDPTRSAATIAAINAHVADRPALQAELGETARLILTRSYGSRPPIIRHAPHLTDQLTAWEKAYFAPEILAGQ
ncbi:MAG: hypothetical protein AB7U20_15210 [Planctomycetaceae bacterium]